MEASVIRREGWDRKSVLRAGSRLWNFPGARTKGARYQCGHLKKHKGWDWGDKAPGWGGPLSRMCLLGRWLLFTCRISRVERKLGWAAEELLQGSEQGFCGERNTLSSLVDASGQKGTMRVRQPGRKSSVWCETVFLPGDKVLEGWHRAPRNEVCLPARSFLWSWTMTSQHGQHCSGLPEMGSHLPFLWRSSRLLPGKGR